MTKRRKYIQDNHLDAMLFCASVVEAHKPRALKRVTVEADILAWLREVAE